MSDRHSDADLIRICLEGSTEDLTESVVARINERISESVLLREAINESPIAAAIKELVTLPLETRSNSEPAAANGGSSRSLKMLVTLLIAGLAVGAGLWWNAQNRQVASPVDSSSEGIGSETVDRRDGALSSDANRSSDTGFEAEEQAIVDSGSRPDNDDGQSESPSPPNVVADSSASPDNSNSTAGNGEVGAAEVGAAKVAGVANTAVAAANGGKSGEPGTTSGPWADELSLEVPPRRLEDIAWQVPGDEQPDQFPPDEFHQWFLKIPGKPFQVGEEKAANRVFSQFSGIAKLNAPWVDSAVLRLGLYDTERCSFTVWSGNRGVQLTYYRHRNPNVWGVCSVTRAGRDGEDALPRLGRFLTSDCGRWHRSNFGVFDLRWNDGYLRMVRGDVVLLSVPFDDRPDEFILSGKLKVRDVRMFRAEPLPESVVQRSVSSGKKNILTSTKPADLSWSLTNVHDGGFSKTDSSGLVRLETTSDSAERSLAFALIPNAGLSETVFRVDSIDPGTGIYFGRANGDQIFRISCVWDTGGNKPAIWFQPAGQHEVERKFDPDAYVVPWTGKGQWIRVVAGYGITTVQMSPDGVNWGWIMDNPIRTDWERVETIGLFTEAKGERRIELASISVNEFPAIAAVADPQILSQVDVAVFEPLNVLDVGAWFHKVTRLQPAGVSFADWQRACAVATLRARPRAPLGIFLLNGLLADGAFSNRANDAAQTSTAWKLLSETSQLVSLLDANRAVQFQQLFHEVARQQVAEKLESNVVADDAGDGPLPATGSIVGEMASLLLSLPLQTDQASALTAQDAARLEIISFLQSNQHERAQQLIDNVIFWNSNAHPSRDWWSQVDLIYPTLAWAELRSYDGVDSEVQTARLALPRRWKTTLISERHPLAQPVSKEAYNVMAEFQAAVDGGAFQDACQVISSAGSANLIGLLPDSQDDQLLVSFPNAVAMAMDRYPELRQQMNDRFGAIGRLRVRQAIENGDYRQVEAATIQFFGTPAAAESDLWLGDRAMSAGQFAQARSFFERAINGFRANSQIESSELASATARLKIVEGLLGEKRELSSAGELTQTVSFGSQQFSPEQVTKLADEIAAARAQQTSEDTINLQATQVPSGRFDVPRVPQLVSHRMENRGRYEGDLGEHVGRSAPADTDWVSRQLASTVVGDLAYLCNRFQISCLDLTNGSTRWSQQLGGNHGSAHQWPMLAMRPLVIGDSVFCRRLTKNGTELVCCQTSDGKIQWQQQLEQLLVSDPFLLRGRLHILATDQSSIGPTVLNLLTVHRESGAVLSTLPVLKLFDAWQNSSLVCQVAVRDAHFFVSTGGAMACCDTEGQTLWVRRRAWTPTNLDSRYRYARSWSAPIVVDDRLIVGQPEGPTIDCLDIQTGRLLWQHVEPELRRVISQFANAILLETRGGLKKISVESGKTQWLHSVSELMDGIAVGTLSAGPNDQPNAQANGGDQASGSALAGRHVVLAVRHVPNQDGRSSTAIPTLVWIDAADGRELARQGFPDLADREARVGPLLVTNDRFFAFVGKDRKEGKRDIVEFVPEPEIALSEPVDQELLAAWHPEFLVSTFADNVLGRPDLLATSIQRDSRNGVDEVCPGWLLIAPPQPGGMGKRAEHRGQKDALELRLQPVRLAPEEQQALTETPNGAIRLVRDVYVPSTGDQSFRFKAGNNSGEVWNLTVDVNGQQIHSTFVNNETAPTGWASIQSSLQRWAGKSVRVVITCSLADFTKQTSVFLSEMNSSALARPVADD
jgi:outer membrane protein assembly factor BamB